MYLVQLLLPVVDNNGREFTPNYLNEVRADLTERFGGVTAFTRSPAVGLWKEGRDDINRDVVVMFEVLTEQLDQDWWAGYRKQLEDKFRQDEILVWAAAITRL